MAKYYKDADDNCTVYVIVNDVDSLSITLWDDGNVDVNLIKMETINLTKDDYSAFTSCESHEALKVYSEIENRLKSIVNNHKA